MKWNFTSAYRMQDNCCWRNEAMLHIPYSWSLTVTWTSFNRTSPAILDAWYWSGITIADAMKHSFTARIGSRNTDWNFFKFHQPLCWQDIVEESRWTCISSQATACKDCRYESKTLYPIGKWELSEFEILLSKPILLISCLCSCLNCFTWNVIVLIVRYNAQDGID